MRDGGSPGIFARAAMGYNDALVIRPQLNKYTGSMNATALLCQIIHWAKYRQDPFFKFIQPCSHPKYKPGESWCEELGITLYEFKGAIRKIGKKITWKRNYWDPTAFVWYWTSDNVTWFKPNWPLIEDLFVSAYSVEVSK